MPNIANVLKQEIARVSRKEVRAETQALKKASAQYRADIAALRRNLAALEKQLGRLGRVAAKKAPAETPAEPTGVQRFSAKGLLAQKRRLGLTAAQMATLLGVSVQSVYKWEDGKARPRVRHMPAIAALRAMSKKEAAARLA